MRLRELLEPPCALVPLTDPAALERELRWVVTTDLPDPSRYLQGGELVVTGMIWRAGPADSERFVAALARSGAAALAAGTAGDDALPADLLAACRAHRLPLLRVPGELAFATLTEYVVRRVSGQRASDLGSVLERHRRLVAAADPAQALGAILELISADLGLACRVIEAGGRIVAACEAPGSSGAADLSEAELGALAHAALTASSLPTRVTAPAAAAADAATADAAAATAADAAGASRGQRAPRARPRRSVFPIDRQDRITDWYLVLDGDFRQWDPQRRSVVDQVADVLAVERARLADRAAGRRADAERLVSDVAAGADVTGRLARLGCTAPGYRALALAVSPAASAAASGPAALLESAFASAGHPALIAPFAENAAAGLPAHAVVLVPDRIAPAADPGSAAGSHVPDADPDHAAPSSAPSADPGSADPGSAAGPHAPDAGSDPSPVALLRSWLDRVCPGLGARRVGVGLSDPVADPARLTRAIDDARHALRVALTRPEPVALVGQSDIASHALLLASVPEEVRRTYRDRMLGSILAYDRAHHSELEATLEAFLRASGSWTRCAAAMHVHVNTLRYRVSRIEELVGRPLTSLETQADLLLALDLRGGAPSAGA